MVIGKYTTAGCFNAAQGRSNAPKQVRTVINSTAGRIIVVHNIVIIERGIYDICLFFTVINNSTAGSHTAISHRITVVIKKASVTVIIKFCFINVEVVAAVVHVRECTAAVSCRSELI